MGHTRKHHGYSKSKASGRKYAESSSSSGCRNSSSDDDLSSAGLSPVSSVETRKRRSRHKRHDKKRKSKKSRAPSTSSSGSSKWAPKDDDHVARSLSTASSDGSRARTEKAKKKTRDASPDDRFDNPGRSSSDSDSSSDSARSTRSHRKYKKKGTATRCTRGKRRTSRESTRQRSSSANREGRVLSFVPTEAELALLRLMRKVQENQQPKVIVPRMGSDDGNAAQSNKSQRHSKQRQSSRYAKSDSNEEASSDSSPSWSGASIGAGKKSKKAQSGKKKKKRESSVESERTEVDGWVRGPPERLEKEKRDKPKRETERGRSHHRGH